MITCWMILAKPILIYTTGGECVCLFLNLAKTAGTSHFKFGIDNSFTFCKQIMSRFIVKLTNYLII